MSNPLVFGESYRFPLEPDIDSQLQQRMAGEKRVIVLANFSTDSYDLSVPISRYPLLWLSGYFCENGGREVTSMEIYESGFPRGQGKDQLAPIQKGLRFFIDAGLEINTLGGRSDRRYGLPMIEKASVQYIEDINTVEVLARRYKIPSQLKRRMDCIGDVINPNNTSAAQRLANAVNVVARKLPLNVKADESCETVLELTHKTTPELSHLKQDQVWFVRGHCATKDQKVFTSNREEDKQKAQKICEGCPVRIRCEKFGKKTGQTGVWGGKYLEPIQ